MVCMSATLLRVLAQRRPASVLTQEAPKRPELESVLRAVAGARFDESPAAWRVVVTNRQSASDLAAAMAGMTSVPNMEGPIPRLKGKKIRRLAAYRGSLQWACTGGVGLAIVFRHDPDSDTPKKLQRLDTGGVRALLEAAFYAQGWATIWSRRAPHDEQVLREFYELSDREEILGWLFVGRPAHNSVPDRAINLPPQDLEITYI